MNNTIRLIGILTLILFIGSCKTATNKKDSAEDTVAKSEEKIDLSTQEAYENFLADWGIQIPENATFNELKQTADGNYKLIYSVEPFDNMQDSLQTYYENMFDDILLEKGWAKPKAGWDPHGTVYEKDDAYFKFFILVSEKHDIYELAFKYGE